MIGLALPAQAQTTSPLPASGSGDVRHETRSPSPDKGKEIVLKTEETKAGADAPLHEAKLIVKGSLLWSYRCSALAVDVSWSPDSTGFLLGIFQSSRSMSLLFLHCEDDGAVYPASVDLDGVQSQIEAKLPQQQGNSAPKSFVDWDSIRWLSPTRCQFACIQRFLGANADSVLELDVADHAHPKLSIPSIKPITK